MKVYVIVGEMSMQDSQQWWIDSVYQSDVAAQERCSKLNAATRVVSRSQRAQSAAIDAFLALSPGVDRLAIEFYGGVNSISYLIETHYVADQPREVKDE